MVISVFEFRLLFREGRVVLKSYSRTEPELSFELDYTNANAIKNKFEDITLEYS